MNRRQSVSTIWNKFWFTPGSALELGILRFLLFSGGALFHFLHQESWETEDFFVQWQPISFFQLFSGPLSNDVKSYIHLSWVIIYFVAGLGIWFRPLAILGSVLGLIYLGHDYNFGVVYHSHHMYIMSCCILSFSRADRGFLLFGKSDVAFRPEYRWPVRWVQSYVIYIMFLCGIEKMVIGGPIQWAFSDAFYMRAVVHPHKTLLRDWLIEQPLFVSQIFSFLGLYVAEVMAPLALFRLYFARFFVGFWVSFHVFVMFIFDFHFGFFSQVFAYSSLVLPMRSNPDLSTKDSENLGSSRNRMLISLGILVFYLFAVSQPIFGKREDWPFSWFGMYSGTVSRDGLSRWDLDYVDQEGREFDLMGENGPYLYLRFDTIFRGLVREYNNQVIVPPGDLKVTEDAISKAKEVLLPSVKYQLQLKKISIQGGAIRLRFKRWKRFHYDLRKNPDENVVVIEIPINELTKF